MGVAILICNYSSQFKQGKNIFKLLFLGAKLNQVSLLRKLEFAFVQEVFK